MTALIIVLIVVVALAIIGLVAYSARSKRRSANLQAGFGSEYDRTVAASDKRRDAERELIARQEEHDQLTLRPLSESARVRYQDNWTAIQAKFVDAPALTLSEADALVTQLLADRGYPTEGFEDQARLLSVEHAHVLEDYRQGHEVEVSNRAGTADTEAVRGAMLQFRRVFEDVMGESVPQSGTATAAGTSTTGPVDPYPVDARPSEADQPAGRTGVPRS